MQPDLEEADHSTNGPCKIPLENVEHVSCVTLEAKQKVAHQTASLQQKNTSKLMTLGGALAGP